jgi:hypothetical protein
MSQSMQQPKTMVDTANVAGRRSLHFQSLDEVLAEVDRLAEADAAGRLTQLGNWTLGQALGHMAAWSEYGYTGFPLKVPFFIKWILRLRKRKFLYEPMRPGVRIPRVEGGTLATQPMSRQEGLDRFRRAVERLKREPQTHPSPVLGPLTHEESIAINLRHAELHLGFFVAAL